MDTQLLELLGSPDVQTRRGSPTVVPNIGRDQLAHIFAALGCRRGVEIGVKQGVYSHQLLSANPEMHLTSIDPWEVSDRYPDKRGQATFDRFYRDTVARLRPFPNSVIERDYSLAVAARTPDRSLDFVYIDGDHTFQACTNDIVEWAKKVKVGGYIAGHDYRRYKRNDSIHVKSVVDAYTFASRITPWFILGRKERVPGEVRDNVRSFLWVNP